MVETVIQVAELPNQFKELVSRAAAGEVVIVSDEKGVRARLLAVPSGGGPRIPGLHAGMIQVSDDFDDPLPDSFWLGEP